MEVELTKASSRGQVVIPKEIREKIKMREGTPFLVSVLSGIVMLRKLNTEKEFEKLHKWGTRLARAKAWKHSEVNEMVHKIRSSKE